MEIFYFTLEIFTLKTLLKNKKKTLGVRIFCVSCEQGIMCEIDTRRHTRFNKIVKLKQSAKGVDELLRESITKIPFNCKKKINDE